jgi:hypothetical protein
MVLNYEVHEPIEFSSVVSTARPLSRQADWTIDCAGDRRIREKSMPGWHAVHSVATRLGTEAHRKMKEPETSRDCTGRQCKSNPLDLSPGGILPTRDRNCLPDAVGGRGGSRGLALGVGGRDGDLRSASLGSGDPRTTVDRNTRAQQRWHIAYVGPKLSPRCRRWPRRKSGAGMRLPAGGNDPVMGRRFVLVPAFQELYAGCFPA